MINDDAAPDGAGMDVNMYNMLLDVDDNDHSRMHVCMNVKSCLT